MKTFIKDRVVIEAVSSLELRAYLLAQGWQIQEAILDKAIVLTKTEIDKNLILPIRRDLGDYALRVSELLSTLADIEARSQISIIDDVNKSGFDVIRLRMTENTEDGSIPLSTTTDVFYQAREMILAAACSAQQPKKVYGSRKSDDALKYMDKVRVGQTEYGSFILTFLSPVAPRLTPAQTDLFGEMIVDDDPFERLATKTLLKGVNATKQAALQAMADGQMSKFEESIAFGVSANLCDAISHIVEKAGTAEISLTWAKTRPITNLQTRDTVLFDKKEAEVIAEAARNFRFSEPNLNQVITGWVYQLRQDQTDPEGTIRITALINDKPRKLKVVLSQQDYNMAASAHTKKNTISIEGDLYLQGKGAELKNPRNLVILDQED